MGASPSATAATAATETRCTSPQDLTTKRTDYSDPCGLLINPEPDLSEIRDSETRTNAGAEAEVTAADAFRRGTSDGY